MKKILVFVETKHFIGKQIAKIPFFHFIKKDNPDCEIVAIGPQKAMKIIKDKKLADRVYSYNSNKELLKISFEILKMKKDIIKVYNHRRRTVALKWLSSLLTNNFIEFSNDKSPAYKGKYNYYKMRLVEKKYIAEIFSNLADHSLNDFAEEVKITESNGEIIFIIGGRRENKRYPLEKYFQIAEFLKNRGEKVKFLLGKEMTEEKALMEGKFDYYYNKTLLEVEDAIRRSKLVIGNDCGPSHYSHLYDTNRVILFRRFENDKNVDEWAYRTEKAIILRPDEGELSNIKVETVIDSALKFID